MELSVRDVEFQGKRIHRNNANIMRISTIPTILLAGRIVTIIRINAIQITQLTAVAEHKTTSKIQAADGIPSAADFISVLVFFYKFFIAFKSCF